VWLEKRSRGSVGPAEEAKTHIFSFSDFKIRFGVMVQILRLAKHLFADANQTFGSLVAFRLLLHGASCVS
jgi:hypothetical protein